MTKKQKEKEARVRQNRLLALADKNELGDEEIARIVACSVTTVVSWFRTPGTASARTVPECVLRLLESQVVLRMIGRADMDLEDLEDKANELLY